MAKDATTLRWMTWSGVVAIVVLLIGQWLIADFVPPPSPHNTLQQTVHIYVIHQNRIRVGLIIAMIGSTFFGPWSIAIAGVMKRMEGPIAPLTMLQVAFGALLVFEFFVPIMMWQAAAFRPTDHPEITYRLHDLASITYDGLPPTAAIQAVILGVAILRDRREQPLLPRWLAYLSFWAAIGFLPGALNPLFHSGPLAWNGILSWWLGLTIFGVWIVAVIYTILTTAIPRIEAEAVVTPGP